MNFKIIKDIIQLAEDFEAYNSVHSKYTSDIKGFKKWISDNKMKSKKAVIESEPEWEGKKNGRSAESVISTILVHLNRYAKSYSRSAISDSPFSTQDEFIYLINLKSFGDMSKMELIKHNVHDKPAGIQIINRLIQQGWVKQSDSITDKRSKTLAITKKGLQVLDKQMDKIRKATQIVSAPLARTEKMQLIRLLHKLEQFHQPIYNAQINSDGLIDNVIEKYLPALN